MPNWGNRTHYPNGELRRSGQTTFLRTGDYRSGTTPIRGNSSYHKAFAYGYSETHPKWRELETRR